MSALTYIGIGAALITLLIYLKNRFASFAAQTPADYAEIIPTIDLREHLSGPIRCEGVIYGPLLG